MISFENISKVYPGSSPALENINLFVKPGEFVSVVGHSGAGKSTLLKLLYTEEKPTTGVVSFDKINLLDLRGRELPGARRFVLQGQSFGRRAVSPGKHPSNVHGW